MQELEADIARLHGKLVRSAQHQKEVAARVVELEATRKRLEEELLGTTEEVRCHELESQVDAAKHGSGSWAPSSGCTPAPRAASAASSR